MSCQLQANIEIECGVFSIGGLKRLLLANFENVTGTTLNDTTKIVDTIIRVEGTKFYEYKFIRNSGSASSPYVANDNGGGYQHTVVVNLKALRQSASIELQTLANGDSIAVVQDANLRWYMLGRTGGLSVASFTPQTGKVNSDLNGYDSLTLQGIEPEIMVQVNPAIIAALLSPAPAP